MGLKPLAVHILNIMLRGCLQVSIGTVMNSVVNVCGLF